MLNLWKNHNNFNNKSNLKLLLANLSTLTNLLLWPKSPSDSTVSAAVQTRVLRWSDVTNAMNGTISSVSESIQ